MANSSALRANQPTNQSIPIYQAKSFMSNSITAMHWLLVALLATASMASSSSMALAGSAAVPRMFDGKAYTCIPDGMAYVCTPIVFMPTSADGPLSSGMPLVLDHGGGDELVPISSSKGTTYLILCIMCVIMGGLMSGLTVGFMSLDPLKMDVMSQVPLLLLL